MDLQEGVKGLKNAVPHTDEERLEIFNLKKWIVNSLVERVTIDRERKLTVKIRLNLLDTPDTNPGQESGAVHFGKVGIYTHTQSCRAHRRHCVICGSPFRPAFQFQPAGRPGRSIER